MLTSVRRPCDLGYSIWSCSIIWNKNELFQYMQSIQLVLNHSKLYMYYQPGLNWILTPASFCIFFIISPFLPITIPTANRGIGTLKENIFLQDVDDANIPTKYTKFKWSHLRLLKLGPALCHFGLFEECVF